MSFFIEASSTGKICPSSHTTGFLLIALLISSLISVVCAVSRSASMYFALQKFAFGYPKLLPGEIQSLAQFFCTPMRDETSGYVHTAEVRQQPVSILR